MTLPNLCEKKIDGQAMGKLAGSKGRLQDQARNGQLQKEPEDSDSPAQVLQ